ncbi:hypothetical protein KS4_17280 [Poriferisphaera corsica]|uniref:Uncharacterized protein n=1 Tax=Poriferisphaera corsica TaxID=2528020 RepID=A0A517YU39_9BACT|nr:hypothetical protein [Poriferisphaera corsica]QDU33672.1 hypothetical protein KS4_17280 [Poriferisphaera corsica]
MLLQSIRHLKDPELQPIYQSLVASSNPTLNIHGVLALGEIDPAGHVDINTIAEMTDTIVQGQIITNALDSDLLNDEQLAQLLNWPGLDIGVKLLIMTRKLNLIDEQAINDLKGALESKKLGRRSLAGYILNEINQPDGKQYLNDLDLTDDSERDAIRQQLLGITLRNQYPAYAPWALKIAKDADVPIKLRNTAIIAALRFKLPEAEQAWFDLYEGTEKFSVKLRLSYSALSVSPFIGPAIFEHLSKSDISLIKQIGMTGKAVSLQSDDIADQVIALIETQHNLAINWAQRYAREYASPDNANMILLGIILSYEKANEKNREQRLLDSVAASQSLYDKDPELAKSVLTEIANDPKTHFRLTQAIMLGLVRSRNPGISSLVQQISSYKSAEAESLALLIKARESQPLDRKQLEELGLIVRGGSELRESLRIQAAWLYLKYTQQTQKAIAAVLAR